MRLVSLISAAAVLCGSLACDVSWAGGGLPAAGSFAQLSTSLGAASTLPITALQTQMASTQTATANVAANPVGILAVHGGSDRRCSSTALRDCEHDHVSPVPEPAGAELALTGLILLALWKRRRGLGVSAHAPA